MSESGPTTRGVFEGAIAATVCGAFYPLATYCLRFLGYSPDEWAKTWVSNVFATALIAALAFVVGYIRVRFRDKEKLSGTTGQWLYDFYLGLRIQHDARGNLFADEPYDVTLELENRTSTNIIVSKIITERFNSKLGKISGSDKIFTHAEVASLFIEPNKTTTVIAAGNNLLPKIVAVRVFHSMSKDPSCFKVDVGGIEVPLSGPRQLPNEALESGMDGLDAVRAALEYSEPWSRDARLVAAFPADSRTMLDLASGLKYIEAQSWVVTLYSKKLGKNYNTIVSSASRVKGGEIEDPDMTKVVKSMPLLAPRIGSKGALKIVRERGLAFGDWKQFVLRQIKVKGNWTYGWHLPYRGRDSLPIILDALTGNSVELGDLADGK